ncbi:MAG TPA: ORF6C domain-containing protein [Candidatus Paenibacillus intestinavium]|nr:ORF6C domain-containing protein [Candidatus Paenibacillus intestinavium]
MSMELISVMGVVEKQLQMTEHQGLALRTLFNGMKQMQDDVSEKFEEVQIMVQEVRDSVTINDVEGYQLQNAVRIRSNKLTKDRYKESDGEFKALVGKYRRMIWSKLKQQFEVAKYSHIRRIDFEDAISFVEDFRPEDYI